MKIKKWNIESKWIHLALIMIGIVFILLSTFHTEVWFDEAYTVALVRHDYAEIVSIGANDVHPILYYLLLKTVTLLFGNSILVCRLFSVAAGILIGILGYTHIRKDFGAKVGLAFSFLMFFLPFMSMYAGEIRMYTWTMLFTTLTAIYAYRIIKKYSIKNWLLFAVFSLAAAHCHYYGLMASGVINAILLGILVFSKKMYQDNTESKKKYIITYLIAGLFQIALYLPWLFIFLKQSMAVSQSYWIQFDFAATILAPLGVQFNGRLSNELTVVFTLLMFSYLIYHLVYKIKHKELNKAVWLSLTIHFSVFLIALLLTVFVKPILYYRYMLITGGVFLFAFAYFLGNASTKKQKIVNYILLVVILGLGIYNNGKMIKENYNSSNGSEVQYIKEQYKEGDMILYQDIFHGTSIAVQIPELNVYLYNIDSSKNLKPYENFSPPIKMIWDEETFENYHGKVIIIDHDELTFYQYLTEKFEMQEIARKQIRTNYRGTGYQIITIEK